MKKWIDGVFVLGKFEAWSKEFMDGKIIEVNC